MKVSNYDWNYILHSNGGIHLSAYIKKSRSLDKLKDKVRKVLIDSSYHLQHAFTPDELINFLKPIENLIKDESTLKRIKGNFAIFRKNKSFKITQVPINFKERCIVADSFHVKPLLKWIQNDKRHLLLVINDESVRLFNGSDKDNPSLISMHFLKYYSAEKFIENYLENWFYDCLEAKKSLDGRVLYIAAPYHLEQDVLKHLKYKKINKFFINETQDLKKITSLIHRRLRRVELQKFNEVINEYNTAKKQNLAQDNIFDISQMVVQGKVKKLIIDNDTKVFGRICKQTGNLQVHLSELDYEDDDILDDLAQKVLQSGGEVIVSDKKKLPGKNAVLAILDNKDSIPIELINNNIMNTEEQI